MKFDIARKIVKFENGKFGIRRLTFIGYQFLNMGHDDDHWWLSPEYVHTWATGTEEQVRERLRVYLAPKAPEPKLPGYDKGRPA